MNGCFATWFLFFLWFSGRYGLRVNKELGAGLLASGMVSGREKSPLQLGDGILNRRALDRTSSSLCGLWNSSRILFSQMHEREQGCVLRFINLWLNFNTRLNLKSLRLHFELYWHLQECTFSIFIVYVWVHVYRCTCVSLWSYRITLHFVIKDSVLNEPRAHWLRQCLK